MDAHCARCSVVDWDAIRCKINTNIAIAMHWPLRHTIIFRQTLAGSEALPSGVFVLPIGIFHYLVPALDKSIIFRSKYSQCTASVWLELTDQFIFTLSYIPSCLVVVVSIYYTGIISTVAVDSEPIIHDLNEDASTLFHVCTRRPCHRMAASSAHSAIEGRLCD